MDLTTPPLRLTVIIASNRHGRFADTVADWYLERARLHDDLDISVLDLADVDLPTALSHEPAPEVTAVLDRVTPQLESAEAFVVITPEYNHSFPASLKNLVDWHFTQWQAKPVAFVSYGGISGGLRAVEQLRQVFAEMHTVTIRETVSFHNAHGHFDAGGTHKDPEAPNGAAKVQLDQLTWWAHALRDAKSVRPYGG
ncbi:NADPH-dependent FMN reductase [Streptomyces sp. NBC_01465]|uniref:NADPH-dependent FMN reductase n=1 Tax=Streptomyces sp. NBC_01465 TaxID=2903878 RepID=UPI002E34753E|nr:NAD(P)H-dependent oxidoreductase [Streptomyces sp. NBC_01465]